MSSLADLPDSVLHFLFRRLKPRDIARLSVQNRRLKEATSDQLIWTQFSKARWPHCSVEHYNGQWRRLYSHRIRLHPAIPAGVDKVHTLRTKMEDSSRQAAAPSSQDKASSWFEETARSLFAVYTQIQLDGIHLHRTEPDYKLLSQDVGWWLCNHPQVVVGYARSCFHSLPDRTDMVPNINWSDVLWRRSALQYLLDMHSTSVIVHQSVIERLKQETCRLDQFILSSQEELAQHGELISCPKGVPEAHWWFHVPAVH